MRQVWLVLAGCFAQAVAVEEANCDLPESCVSCVAATLVFLTQEPHADCEAIWSLAIKDSAGANSVHHCCPSRGGVGKNAWLSEAYQNCWESIREAAMAQKGVTLCAMSLGNETHTTLESVLPEPEEAVSPDELPVCGRLPVVPVWGSIVETEGTIWSGTKQVKAWDYQLHDIPCRIGVRETWHMEQCLQGTWLVLLGASQSSVWLQQLANTLVPGAFNALRDNFVTDGVYLQLMDLILEDGKIVHKTIVFTGDKSHLNQHKGAHSQASDGAELPFVFAKLALAPAFTGKQIRITNMLAEYWDEANLGLLAIEGMKEGGWDKSNVFPVVAVGLWYAYSKGCHFPWCETRPSLAGLDTEGIVEMFLQGMRRTAGTLQRFCGPKGRAEKHGCTVMSVEYCSEYYKNPIYGHLHEAMRANFQEFTSMQVRYFDVWSFTEQVPEDCLYGHMTPASAAFMIQVLLSSICPTSDVAEQKLITFLGEACLSSQIIPSCPGMNCQGFSYVWDYALSRNCKLLGADGQVQNEESSGGSSVEKWMIEVDKKALAGGFTTTSTTTTTTAQNISQMSEKQQQKLAHKIFLSAGEIIASEAKKEMKEKESDKGHKEEVKTHGKSKEKEEYSTIFDQKKEPRHAETKSSSSSPRHVAGNVFMAMQNAINSQQDEGTSLWIVLILYLALAIAAAKYCSSCLQVSGANAYIDWLIPGVKVSPGEKSADGLIKMEDACDPVSSQTTEVTSDYALLNGHRLEEVPSADVVVSVVPGPPVPPVAPAPARPPAPRFAFGVARYLASLHVVVGHLNARGALNHSVYLCSWGYTWVPWFFMLSGFILCAAEIQNPREEGSVEYVSRRLVTIYPVYAFGLIVAALLTSQGPPPWVLVLQAWLLQAWIPVITEWGLQMQCWFLSCLVLYWAIFPYLFRMIQKMSLQQVILSMVLAVCVPVLYLLIPDLFYGKATWYENHSWGLMRNATDALVVMLKFHPLCYLHVFLLGMLLAQFRVLMGEFLQDVQDISNVTLAMDLLAPVGYLGLLLVFNWPMASPPYAKLSARIFALLPLQALVVVGLAGLKSFPVPRLATWFSSLNFLESYSYCVYVMQFICMTIWFGEEFDLSFFVFLIATATFVQLLVQTPSEKLWKLSPGQASWIVPTVVSLLLVLISMWRWKGAPDHVLPDLIEGDGYLDIHLPLQLSAEDWSITGGGAFINPSISLVDGNLVVAARLHRRSYKVSSYENGTLLEEIWFSKILLGSIFFSSRDWSALNSSGTIPGGQIPLRPWNGLRMMDSKPWVYPNMCYRERWLPENKTMLRFVVTGPEDPKVFPLTFTAASCSQQPTDCWSVRKHLASDWCSTSELNCEQCNLRWCSPSEQVQVAFNSYTPKEDGVSCHHRDVSQMFLASGVDVRHPDLVNHGRHLKCGQLDHDEKNWIPFQRDGETYVVYSLLPHLVRQLDTDGRCGQQWRSIFPKLEKMQSQQLDMAIRGSAQAIYVDVPNATRQLPRPHFLALFHAADLKVRRYAHYAYRFAPMPPFQILQVSKPLPLQMLPPTPGAPAFAFASGLVVHQDQVILTYAAGDREPRAFLMSLSRLDEFFQ